MTFRGSNEQLVNALRETAARLSGAKMAICEAAAERLSTKAPTLDRPAQIGNTVFREGVSTETVIRAAQRYYQHMHRDGQPSSPSDQILAILDDTTEPSGGEYGR